MTDFRNRLYNQYLSGFHEEHTRVRDSRRRAYYRWLDYKLKPFLADLAPDARIIELGCGVGDLLDYLKSRGFTDARGMDCCEAQVEIAQSQGHAALRADVFEYLDKVEEPFDAALALDFIEHFTKDELLTLFDALRKTLKPGGRLILQTPNGEGLFAREVIYGDLTHLTVFTPRSLRQILAATGFENIRFIECGPAPTSLKGVIKVVLWRALCAFANAARFVELGSARKIWTVNMICVAENT